jgi:hypothetical protein
MFAASPSTAAALFKDGESLLLQRRPAEALAAFTQAAALGHVPAHAAAAALHFEGGVAHDGSAVDCNFVEAYSMCVCCMPFYRCVGANDCREQELQGCSSRMF